MGRAEVSSRVVGDMVIAGLKENERLVVKGYETLRNDSKVKVIR